MDFSIPALVGPDWRQPGVAPGRGLNDQLWEVLESLDGSAEIGALMQGIRLIDRAMHADQTIDLDEWQEITRAMRSVLGPKATRPSSERAGAILRAFELRAQELSRR